MDKPNKRIIMAGFVVLGLSLLAGIALSCYIYRDGSPHPNDPGFFVRSTFFLPFAFILGCAATTIPVFFISAGLILISLNKRKLWWLSIIAFIILGLYWLLWILLASRIPMD
jgi:apolipoprotein N-acyltransferase